MEVVKYDSFSEASPELLNLLHAIVMDVCWAADGTISIRFDAGCVVELYDENKQYESYTINTPAGLIVV